MSRRLLLPVALLLAVVLAGSLLSPHVRWAAWGWLHGEAFHRGLPTSYWAGRLRDKPLTLFTEYTDQRGAAVSVSLGVSPSPWSGWADAVRRRLGLSPAPSMEVFLDGRDSGSAAPVLAELLKDDDPQVIEVASLYLSIMGPDARNSLPALVAALAAHADDKEDVRFSLASALLKVAPQPEVAVPALTRLLKGGDKTCAACSAQHLGNIGPGASEAVPALVEALTDDDAVVREVAAQALKQIDPQAAAEAGVP